jgi:hypothetical protein
MTDVSTIATSGQAIVIEGRPLSPPAGVTVRNYHAAERGSLPMRS